MQIRTVSAATGAVWLRDGWRLFRRQPLGLPAMVVVYLMMLFLPALLPFVGIAISGVLAPFATVGLMAACREVALGRAPNPAVFAQPFQESNPNRIKLFRLGVINASLVLLLATLLALVGDDLHAPPADAQATLADVPWEMLLLQLLVYLPVLVLMWFAPLLAGWHGLGPAKAMFGSVVACGRNVGALLVYGLVASAATLIASTVIVGVAAMLVSSRELLSLLLAPFALVMMTIVQASFYPMYRSIFADDHAALEIG
ncbi:MAG: BPSS1780 family membrane protein [Burkholderiaceae bacterium]